MIGISTRFFWLSLSLKNYVLNMKPCFSSIIELGQVLVLVLPRKSPRSIFLTRKTNLSCELLMSQSVRYYYVLH